MSTPKKTQTADLGFGWQATHYVNGDGLENMVVRNPGRGKRIDLDDPSVKKLRQILNDAEGARA